MKSNKDRENRTLIAAIGDEDTITGLLLSGIGHIDGENKPNFAIVTSETSCEDIDMIFSKFTQRQDVAIVFITQPVADKIRHAVDAYKEIIPSVLEIASKDSPYDASKDSVLKRIRRFD